MVPGAISMKFGMMKHKKMFSRTVKNFLIFFQGLLLFLELKMQKNDLIWHIVTGCSVRPF